MAHPNIPIENRTMGLYVIGRIVPSTFMGGVFLKKRSDQGEKENF